MTGRHVSSPSEEHPLIATMDKSWEKLLRWASVVTAVRDSPRAERSVSRYVARELGLSQSRAAPLSKEGERIAALAPEALFKGVLRSGLCFFHEAVRARISGPQVRALLEAFGEEFYDFTLFQAPVIAEQLGLGCEPSAENGVDPHVLRQRVERLGTAVLVAALQPTDSNNIRRILLKLPVGWSQGVFVTRAPLPPEEARALFETVLAEETEEEGLHGQDED